MKITSIFILNYTRNFNFKKTDTRTRAAKFQALWRIAINQSAVTHSPNWYFLMSDSKLSRQANRAAWGDALNSALEKSAVKVQSWWRMKQTQKAYRERLQPVHIVTFAVGLFIRLAILAYLITMLYVVASVMHANEEPSSPANAQNLTVTVLRKLLTTDSSGLGIIVACRCGCWVCNAHSRAPKHTKYCNRRFTVLTRQVVCAKLSKHTTF